MGGNSSTVVMSTPRTPGLLYNFVETGGIIGYVFTNTQLEVLHRSMFLFSFIFRDIYREDSEESSRALFKGLGLTLVGVVPARSINFTYGNGKRIISDEFNNGERTAGCIYLLLPWQGSSQVLLRTLFGL